MELNLDDFTKEIIIPYINALNKKVERVIDISTEGHLVLKDLLSGDTFRDVIDKVNYNFHSIMAYGGGPQGEQGVQGIMGQKGETGLQGPKGERGVRGTKWYLSSFTGNEINFSTEGKLEGDFVVDGNLQVWEFVKDENDVLNWKKSINFDRQFNIFHYNETTKHIKKNKDIDSALVLGGFESSSNMLNFNNNGILHLLTNSGDSVLNNAIEISSFTFNNNNIDVNNSKMSIANNDGVGKISLLNGKSLDISSNLKTSFYVGSNDILSLSTSRGLFKGSLFISNSSINAIPLSLNNSNGVLHVNNGIYVGLKPNTQYNNLNDFGLYVHNKGYFEKNNNTNNVALQLNGLIQLSDGAKNKIMIGDDNNIMQLKDIDELLIGVWKKNESGNVVLNNINDVVKIGDVESIGRLNIDGSIYINNTTDSITTMLDVNDYTNTASDNIIGGISISLNGVVGLDSFDIYID